MYAVNFQFWLDRDHAGWRDEFDNFHYDEKQIAELAKKTGRAKDAIILRQTPSSARAGENLSQMVYRVF